MRGQERQEEVRSEGRHQTRSKRQGQEKEKHLTASLGLPQVTSPLNHSVLCVVGPLPPTLHRNALPSITPQPLTRHSHTYSQTLSHQGDLLHREEMAGLVVSPLFPLCHTSKLSTPSLRSYYFHYSTDGIYYRSCNR